ncbi:hypothetical protein DRH29_02895 [candidate division Kazan bacterium]|uniref:Uncharacterized protein n=1 Tax=candidate division Kazan bacterium TaxID=2202143 RepID=A0A420ZCV0_UNCK3|nr:MAG: hypothetical protein DRH29_02895 [candidate division Kazan bacterium]
MALVTEWFWRVHGWKGLGLGVALWARDKAGLPACLIPYFHVIFLDSPGKVWTSDKILGIRGSASPSFMWIHLK